MLKRVLLLLIFSLLLFKACSYGDYSAQEVITPALVKKYVEFLASDSLKGRNTPSAELDIAANYIADEFRHYGVMPVNGTYFQKVTFGKISLGDENYLKISKEGAETSFKIKDEFTPFEMTASKEVSGKIVFAGYGIDAPAYDYNDYEGIDVKGKIVLVLRHEPEEEDTSSKFLGNKPTEFSEVNTKVKIALEKGAAGIMVVTDPLNHSSLSPRGFPWPSLSKLIPKDALPLSLLLDENNKIPVIQVGKEVINFLFGSTEELIRIQRDIDKDLKPNSFEIKDAVITMKTSTRIEEMSSNNVIGYIEGSDPELKKEFIVIGAHYDHDGIKKNAEAGEDSIFNGADDNASGTAAMMTIAAAFGEMKIKPKRSLLFMAFAGEEKGLFGSRFYVNNPLFPLDKTAAMLNLDMVGRGYPDSLYIVGHTRNPDLKEINIEENENIGFILAHKTVETQLGGSDHAPFFGKNIPFLFYHTELHEDYHKVTDEAALINFDKAARIAKLAFRTALRISNENKHYKIIPKPISLIN